MIHFQNIIRIIFVDIYIHLKHNFVPLLFYTLYNPTHVKLIKTIVCKNDDKSLQIQAYSGNKFDQRIK